MYYYTVCIVVFTDKYIPLVVNGYYSLMRGRIKGPRPPVNPMQSDKTFITWVIKILHGNGAPKATNLRLATRMSLPAATICSALTAAIYKIR